MDGRRWTVDGGEQPGTTRPSLLSNDAPSTTDNRQPTTVHRPPSTVRLWLLAILAAYALLSLAYNLLVPVGEGPDEVDHIRYVEHIVRYGHLPAIGTGSSERPYTIEAKQPATYYLIQAAVMLALGRDGKQLIPEMETDLAFRTTGVRYRHPPIPDDLLPWTHIMRFFGMLCGLGTIVLLYATTREVFTDERRAPLALAVASMGLLPQFTFITSVVNNDHLAIVMGAAISYLMARTLMRGVTWRASLLLGLALGVGLMTKTNLLVYIPIALLALALPGMPRFAAKEKGAWGGWAREWAAFARKRVPVLAVVGAICLLVGGWWLLRNLLKYGDLLGTSAVSEMAQQVFPRFIITFDASDPAVFFERLMYTVDTHLGWFGWESLRAPEPFFWVYYALLVLAILGLVALIFRQELTGWQKACLMLAVLVFELFYVSLVWHGAWRGRLLFPALASTGLLAVVGTYSWLGMVLKGRWKESAPMVTAVVWGGFLLVANVVSLVGVIMQRY
ncbi:MAG: glycosyltransferase family 39 protein [Chloroflexia bacterium]